MFNFDHFERNINDFCKKKIQQIVNNFRYRTDKSYQQNVSLT